MSHLVLILSAEAGPNALDRLAAGLGAAPIASVVLVPMVGAPFDAATLKPLVAAVQARDAAALVLGDAPLAKSVGADGVHLAVSPEAAPGALAKSYAAARAVLGKDRIVGVEIANGSKHDAMEAGEGGADYVAFSGADMIERLGWWSEIFVLPCIGMGTDGGGVAGAQDVAELIAAGADFAALALPMAQTAGDIAALVKGAHDAAGQALAGAT